MIGRTISEHLKQYSKDSRPPSALRESPERTKPKDHHIFNLNLKNLAIHSKKISTNRSAKASLTTFTPHPGKAHRKLLHGSARNISQNQNPNDTPSDNSRLTIHNQTLDNKSSFQNSKQRISDSSKLKSSDIGHNKKVKKPKKISKPIQFPHKGPPNPNLKTQINPQNPQQNKPQIPNTRLTENIFSSKEKKEDLLTRAKKLCQKHDKKLFDKKHGISDAIAANNRVDDEKKDFLLLIKDKMNDDICHEKVAGKVGGKVKKLISGNIKNSLSRIRNLFDSSSGNYGFEDCMKTDRGSDRRDELGLGFRESTNRSFTTRKAKHETLVKSPLRVGAKHKDADGQEKSKRVIREKLLYTSVQTLPTPSLSSVLRPEMFNSEGFASNFLKRRLSDEDPHNLAQSTAAGMRTSKYSEKNLPNTVRVSKKKTISMTLKDFEQQGAPGLKKSKEGFKAIASHLQPENPNPNGRKERNLFKLSLDLVSKTKTNFNNDRIFLESSDTRNLRKMMQSPNVGSSLGPLTLESCSRGMTTQRSIEGLTSHRNRTNHSLSTKGFTDLNSVRHKFAADTPANFTKTLKPEILVKNVNVCQDDFYTKFGGPSQPLEKNLVLLKSSTRLNSKDKEHLQRTPNVIKRQKLVAGGDRPGTEAEKKIHLNSRKSQKDRVLKTPLSQNIVTPFVNHFTSNNNPTTTKNQGHGGTESDEKKRPRKVKRFETLPHNGHEKGTGEIVIDSSANLKFSDQEKRILTGIYNDNYHSGHGVNPADKFLTRGMLMNPDNIA
jgi:hypothetical protein